MPFKYFGSATTSDIAKFETKFKVCLPEDYKRFLLSYDGGILESEIHWVPTIREFAPLSVLYGFRPSNGYDGNSLQTNQEELNDELFDSEILIGASAFNNPIILICSQEFGGIYYYDRLFEHRKSRGQRTLHLMAFTFDEFLCKIQPAGNVDEVEVPAWQKPVHWPAPLPKVDPKQWPPRKPQIWALGDMPKFKSRVPGILRDAKPYASENRNKY